MGTLGDDFRRPRGVPYGVPAAPQEASPWASERPRGEGMLQTAPPAPQGVVQRAATLIPVAPSQAAPVARPAAGPQESVVSRTQRLQEMGLVSREAVAIADATGLDPLQVEGRIKRTPGTAAVTREDLLAADEQAVAMRQGRQETTRNAWTPEDADEKEARDLLALETRAGAESAKIDATMDAARVQEEELARQYGTSRAEVEAWEQSLSNEEKQLITDLSSISQAKVDPGRLFSSRGVPGTALSMLGDALTTYAEFRAGRPLSRQLQADIQADIAMQEQELARKGEGKQTELAQLQRQFGDLGRAKLALQAKQEAYAATQLQRASLLAEEPAIRAEMEAAAQERWNASQDTLVQMRMGERTVSETSAFAQPRAGTRGGMSLDRAGLAEDVSKAGIGGVTPAQLEDYGKQLEAPEKMMGGVDALVNQFPESLRLTEDGGVEAIGDIPGTGVWDERKPFLLQSDRDLAFKAAADELVDVIAKSGGGVMTESDIARAMTRIGSGTERERVAALSALRRAAMRAKTDVSKRFPAQVRQVYDKVRSPEEQRNTRTDAAARAEDQLGQGGAVAESRRK